MTQERSRFWQSPEERTGGAAVPAQAERELPGPGDVLELAQQGATGQGLVQLAGKDVTRRDFFSLMGLSAAAASLAACQRAPVARVIPYLVKPDEVTPGVSIWYASACGACDAQCGVLLKSRDGRPIKVEGNPEHPVSRGGVCAVGQAAVLSLYDASRARGPLSAGAQTSWAALDAAVLTGLAQVQAAGKVIRVVAPLRTGPLFEAALARFVAAWPGARAVRFEPTGEATAIADATQALYGVRALPELRFDKARVIGSFAADFLGTWIAPVTWARQYADARRLPQAPREVTELVEASDIAEGAAQEKHEAVAGKHEAAAGKHEAAVPVRVAQFARHWQLEPALSLTGSNADRRVPLAPSELVPALAGLVRRLAARSAHPDRAAILAALPALPEPQLGSALDALAADLSAAGSAGLVVCGLADAGAQALTAAANELLGAVGTTVLVASGAPLDASSLTYAAFLGELAEGTVGAVLFAGTNPVYAHPRGEALSDLLARVPLTLSLADRVDETARFVAHLAPDHAPAESWGDAEPRRGLLTLRQPALAPLFETRAKEESLLRWAQAPVTDPHELLRARLLALYPHAAVKAPAFEVFWQRALHDGFVESQALPVQARFAAGKLPALAATAAQAGGETEVWLHQKVALRDGRLANNGWLQELPDPISKAVWDNHAAISPARAARLGLVEGQLVSVTAGGRSVELPVLIQPGTHDGVVAIALGYGRTAAGAVGDGIGARAIQLAESNGRVRFSRAATLAAAAGRREIARSQTQASLEGRPHLRTATLAAFRGDPGAANPPEEKLESIWSAHEYKGHRWGLAIDLSACTGCAACVVSCSAENNVPVVGRDEVARGREMHWLRIDRYYAGEPANPEVLHQPMLCQHCTNAPCETVCPVLATVHSSEGLNQQVYNRCVGTRYCANNCPPKVRRFNWFEYRHDDPVERLVLNPDVAVRSRGVMEKCSLCVQRIGEGKAQAKREGRPLGDGEIQTACQQGCPSQALVFGDLNDPKSRLSALAGDARSYHLLSELNIGPVVNYLTRIKDPGAES